MGEYCSNTLNKQKEYYIREALSQKYYPRRNYWDGFPVDKFGAVFFVPLQHLDIVQANTSDSKYVR